MFWFPSCCVCQVDKDQMKYTPNIIYKAWDKNIEFKMIWNWIYPVQKVTRENRSWLEEEEGATVMRQNMKLCNKTDIC